MFFFRNDLEMFICICVNLFYIILEECWFGSFFFIMLVGVKMGINIYINILYNCC